MRTRPLLHPSAQAVAAAPRRDGLWVTVWTTPDGMLCVTIGTLPGDASTSRRGSRHSDERAARAAATHRLNTLWDAYLCECPVPRQRWRDVSVTRLAGAERIGTTVANEGPVTARVARAAARHCLHPQPAQR